MKGQTRLLTFIHRVSTVEDGKPKILWESKPKRLLEGAKFKTYWPAEYEKDGNFYEVRVIWNGAAKILHQKWFHPGSDQIKPEAKK